MKNYYFAFRILKIIKRKRNKMFYLIQHTEEERFPFLIEAMDKLGIEYEVCKYKPFIHEIEFKTDRKDIFCFGAYEMSGVSEKYGFNPGQIDNKNNDYEIYAPKYGFYNMLNGDSTVIEFTDALPEGEQWEEFFARPTIDKKLFKGQIFTKQSWQKYVQDCVENDTVRLITDISKVIIAPIKKIQQEIRCWVVAGRVITLSQYKLGSRIVSKNLDDDYEARDFAQKMVDKYEPSEAFCLDICRTDKGLKIIEINGINASGFYHMDCEKLLMALEKHYSYEREPATHN